MPGSLTCRNVYMDLTFFILYLSRFDMYKCIYGFNIFYFIFESVFFDVPLAVYQIQFLNK